MLRLFVVSMVTEPGTRKKGVQTARENANDFSA
jgi:hypothetical protein